MGNIWQVEKIFIFMGDKQEKIQTRSFHRDFKPETCRLDIVSGLDTTEKLKKEFCLV